MDAIQDRAKLFRTRLNLETAQIAWKELQRFFAGGTALMVSADLDLVEVAYQMSEDNAAQIQHWMEADKLCKVTAYQAAAWFEADALVWAVVGKSLGASATFGQLALAGHLLAPRRFGRYRRDQAWGVVGLPIWFLRLRQTGK
ncbi:MAG: DUF2288 domain-containing protein [Gallionella sp.]